MKDAPFFRKVPMKSRSIPTTTLLALLALVGCDHSESVSQSPTPTVVDQGKVAVSVKLGAVGVLARAAQMTPTRLVLQFTSTHSSTVADTITVSGSGTVAKSYDLASQQNWTLQATGLDQRDSVLYSGTSAFHVSANQTTNLSLSLDARYSSLRVRFPVRDSLTRFVLSVDGTVWGDSSVAVQSRVGDTVKFDHDYLAATPAGTAHTFSLQVFGKQWGQEALFYTYDTSLNIVSGSNLGRTLTLKWVGPNLPPPGQATLSVLLGTVGQVDLGVSYQDTTTSPKSGTFVDGRDGLVYPWVKIGTQTWMAANLEYAGIGHCYLNNPGFCLQYGRAYNFSEILGADQPSSAIPSGIRGICPMGWHIPSFGEWQQLLGVVGDGAGIKLRSISNVIQGIPGTDLYGFNWKKEVELSAGVGVWNISNYGGRLWSSSFDGTNFSYYLDPSTGVVTLYHAYDLWHQYPDEWGLRCVKDQ